MWRLWERQVPTATQPDKSVYDVVVENPQKVGEKKSYVAYTVRTVTTADNKTTEQQRRYNDFFWLYEHLKATHPTCVVPQVPEKTISLLHHHRHAQVPARCVHSQA